MKRHCGTIYSQLVTPDVNMLHKHYPHLLFSYTLYAMKDIAIQLCKLSDCMVLGVATLLCTSPLTFSVKMGVVQL